MNETEQEILAALLELQRAVETMRTTVPKPNLVPIFARLDRLADQLTDRSDPQLRHFLHNKSYEKARLLLEGRGPENAAGSCGKH